MISNTREEAIKTAATYVREGHKVAIITGRGVNVVAMLEAIAERVPGARYEAGRVKLNGTAVVFPRNPFMAGAGLHGFSGAVVIEPSFAQQIFGSGEATLQRIVDECHKRAGILA